MENEETKQNEQEPIDLSNFDGFKRTFGKFWDNIEKEYLDKKSKVEHQFEELKSKVVDMSKEVSEKMEVKPDLPQGTYVHFKIDPIEGNGKIVGIANTGLPILGKTYIIEPDIPLTDHPYSHFICPEIYLTVLPEPTSDGK